MEAKSFGYNKEDKSRELNRIDPMKPCRLGIVGKELTEISDRLQTKVHAIQGKVTSIDCASNRQAPNTSTEPANELYQLVADHWDPTTQKFEPNP